MAKWLRRVTGDCNSLQTLCHFAWHRACQCIDTRGVARFNIAAALSILFLSRILPVAISPLVLALKSLNLNINIRHKLPLFWSIWRGPGAWTGPRVLVWRNGSDYSYMYSLWALRLAALFPELSKVLKNPGPHNRHSPSSSPTVPLPLLNQSKFWTVKLWLSGTHMNPDIILRI